MASSFRESGSLDALTLAVFATMPVASGSTVTVAMNVAVPSNGRSTVVAMAPVPLDAPQLPPGVVVHNHVTPASDDGNVSLTAAPATSLGPALCTVMV